MSIAMLVQVSDETHRLALAGSAVAAGDFRLKKLIPPLQQAGEKAPVFAKVAQSIQAVVDSNEKTASTALLDLATLVNAILYTQGETGIAGELKPLETTTLAGQTTQASARMLKPLLEALSSTGSGRLEIIRDAYDRGMFKDLRLVKPSLNALDDSYSEIADLVAEKILPLYGKAIVPELRAKLNIKNGATGNQNRLRLLHQLDPEGSRDMVQLALNEGVKEMKVVAVECLSTGDEDLGYLLEQTKAKARDLRAAALRALSKAKLFKSEIIGALKSAIAGSDLELVVGNVKKDAPQEIQDFVLEQAEKQFAETLKCKDAKLQGPAIERLQQLVLSLEGRTDAGAEAFLLKCFDSGPAFESIKSEPSGKDFNELVAQVLSQGTPKMQQQLVGAHKRLSGPALMSAMFAARAIMTPAGFYEEFSPLLKLLGEKKNKKGEIDRATSLVETLGAEGDHRYFYFHRMRSFEHERPAITLRELDPRWLDSAIEAKAEGLVCELARPGHAGAIQFLTGMLDNRKKPHDTEELLQTMVRIGHPGAADAIIDILKSQAKATSYYYLTYYYGRMISDLPRSAFPKFEALLPTLPEKMVDQLMDSVLALKNKPE